MTTQRFNPDIVDDARRGNEAALSNLVRVAIPVVLGWTARLGGPKIEAEDAAHEVMLVVLDRIHTVRDPLRFNAWLFQVTRKVLARHRRRVWWSRWVPGASLERVDPRIGPEDEAARHQLSHKVREALESLPEAQREIFVLCDIEEHTDTEAAEILDLPVGTVKSRLRLARVKFREAAYRLKIAPDLVEVTSSWP